MSRKKPHFSHCSYYSSNSGHLSSHEKKSDQFISNRYILQQQYTTAVYPEAYSEPCQVSKMERFRCLTRF